VESLENALDIQVYDVYPASILAMGITQAYPGSHLDAGGKRHWQSSPVAKSGVNRHEQAHTSYSYLSPEQKRPSPLCTPL